MLWWTIFIFSRQFSKHSHHGILNTTLFKSVISDPNCVSSWSLLYRRCFFVDLIKERATFFGTWMQDLSYWHATTSPGANNFVWQHDSPIHRRHVSIFMSRTSLLFQWMLPRSEPISHPLWYTVPKTTTQLAIKSFPWALHFPARRPRNRTSGHHAETRSFSKFKMSVRNCGRMQCLRKQACVLPNLPPDPDGIKIKRNR